MTMSRMLGVFDGIASDVLKAFPYRCAVMRNRKASCTKCADACTTGAISITEDEVSVDADKCVGCGTCATVCPTCALEANNPNDAVLATTALDALIAARGVGVVMCDHAWERYANVVDPQRVTRVRCLGRVDESVCVSLVAAGADRVALVHGVCDDCERHVGKQTYELVAATADELLETWGSDVRVELTQELPAEAMLEPGQRSTFNQSLPYDEDRRRLFSEAGRSMLHAVCDSLPLAGGQDAQASQVTQVTDEGGRAQAARFMKTMKDGTLPHFIPDRRERLLDALAELGQPEDAALETRLWGRVVIDASKCRTCYGCATFCPTGAITKWKDETGEGVDHSPADCVKCRCCTDICPTGALTLLEDVMAPDVASGAVVQHWVLPSVTDDRGRAHSVVNRMRKMLSIDQVYER